ncbi:copper-binding metallochaperone CopP [Helicobacter mustelae]|uniref:Putative heavy-metal-associated protein n=1 Tax=Helicobacter mustelae (strain ATCC 43772 / CCUG 25715 / CIP 103759 / LMG 18044 / NCTC 12198 / R85-136P) TaxID=679897 RepID=D3UG64_HELM1|nr:copper-binding metallochaperone CopP [Helicobacter mustelae]CBG39485.1 putative heavy-metal-associated protein [Helicobacter mustelae 12198]SQH70998.1 heavy-metal-associated protein [Helicobacter mustelae]STP12126.1 heavy-metal-associated protein [Helicobacter mustelae]
MEKIFLVDGMRCNHCVDKIEKFVGEIDGVELVDVDLQNQKVKVVFEPAALETQIKDAILDSGYEVRE